MLRPHLTFHASTRYRSSSAICSLMELTLSPAPAPASIPLVQGGQRQRGKREVDREIETPPGAEQGPAGGVMPVSCSFSFSNCLFPGNGDSAESECDMAGEKAECMGKQGDSDSLQPQLDATKHQVWVHQ